MENERKLFPDGANWNVKKSDDGTFVLYDLDTGEEYGRSENLSEWKEIEITPEMDERLKKRTVEFGIFDILRRAKMMEKEDPR